MPVGETVVLARLCLADGMEAPHRRRVGYKKGEREARREGPECENGVRTAT